jgi:hypothetical protein
VDFRSRCLVALVVLSSAVVLGACGKAAVTTGVVTGTADPCIGMMPSSVVGTWKFEVLMRRGSTVIARRTVTDSKGVDQPFVDQAFSFTEPAGSYTVSGPARSKPVVIKAGRTVRVVIPDACK